MPFTPSHIAAVLPLRGRAGRGLPIAALAAGSVSPDLLYFQPFVDWRLVTPSPHSLAGIVTWDLLLGFALWVGLRQPVTPAAPRPRPTLARSASWVVAASAILAATLRLASLDASTGLRSVVFSGITAAMGTAAATVVLITTAHALTSHPPAPTDPTLQRIRQDSR